MRERASRVFGRSDRMCHNSDLWAPDR